MKKAKVKFEGIDIHNRPVFKEVGKRYRYGATHKLFTGGTAEAEVKKEITEFDLCYFGNSFGCEPMGLDCNVEIEWRK